MYPAGEGKIINQSDFNVFVSNEAKYRTVISEVLLGISGICNGQRMDSDVLRSIGRLPVNQTKYEQAESRTL